MMAKLTNSEKCKAYRSRKKLQPMFSNVKNIQKCKLYREAQKKRKLEEMEGCDEATCVVSKVMYDVATEHFVKRFYQNPFGAACDICDRLWFKNDLKHVPTKYQEILVAEFPNRDVTKFVACSTCQKSLAHNKVPLLSTSNGFVFPNYPADLPNLNMVEERLVSPRLPFMQIRRLRYVAKPYEIVGQVVNVPIDVQKTLNLLPRQLDEDNCINVNMRRRLLHKSTCLQGTVRKSHIKTWMNYLMTTPLYRAANVKCHPAFKDSDFESDVEKEENECIETVEPNDQGTENLMSQQQSLLWNDVQSEYKYLVTTPGQNQTSLSLLYDDGRWEMSFPQIFLGHRQTFKNQMHVSLFQRATSIIRRSDRRGAKPTHILYMAAMVMQSKVHNKLHTPFVNSQEHKQTTRKMINNKDFLEECVNKNFMFLKSITNSMEYWSWRKRDLFSMMRQLGKPTIFLTLSANEIGWPVLLKTLYRLQHGREFDGTDIVVELNSEQKFTLINEDPVTCVVYFNRIVETILSILSSKKFSPFGNYTIVDYFKRVEFQRRGSAHAHILLWLSNAPTEEVSEDMPETVRLIDTLSTVSRDYEAAGLRQTHKHTHTCYKKNDKKKKCRFGVPFWPMPYTRILLPMDKEDSHRERLKRKFKRMHERLEDTEYNSLEDFLAFHRVNFNGYLNIIRAGIKRPTVFMKRSISEIKINPFNPWIAQTLYSNMDLQYILDEYSCAAYVVEYVNKTNRGVSDLHRELVKLAEDRPDMDYTDMIKRLGIKVLNPIEMCSQEAAWYLLRIPMCETSRKVDYIPTVWPQERLKTRKSNQELENEEDESTAIWRSDKIEKYEDRPVTLADVNLAEFVANYYLTATGEYKRRQFSKVLRWRGYDMSTDLLNYKREMVLLFHPFKNEELELLTDNKFIEIFDQEHERLVEARKVFTSGMDVVGALAEYERINKENEKPEICSSETRPNMVISVGETDRSGEHLEPNNEDLTLLSSAVSAIRKRENVMSSEEYCLAVRGLNLEQKEFVLEVINRLLYTREPLQVFFTGPAGCGKTHTIKLVMETVNRFSQQPDCSLNAYVATASTGKAAVAINGSTVHSALRINLSVQDRPLNNETLQIMRSEFRNVKLMVVDEVSMIGAELLLVINNRLQQLTENYEDPFGGIHMVFCGDLRQLPPVRATPVYKRLKKCFSGEILWRVLKYFPLTQVMRQSDKAFSDILTKIGNGDKLDDEERKLIESRFVSVEEAAVEVPNAIRLFHRNIDVTNYNRQVFNTADTLTLVATDSYSGFKTSEQECSARTKMHRMTVQETGGLPYQINLLTGKPYMISANVDVVDGLVNGSVGELKYIERAEDSTLSRLWLDFGDPRIGRIARAKTRSAVHTSGGRICKTWVPITKRNSTVTFRNRLQKCRRNQMPLVEAAALTIHKSQGGTYNEVVYDYSPKHEQTLVYVALSRGKSLQKLYLTSNDSKPPKFKHAIGTKHKDLRTETTRLESNRLRTVTDEWKEFVKQPLAPVMFTLLTFNVQSLKAHYLDIEKDCVINTVDIMSLTETWVADGETVEIAGYRKVNQHKRKDVRAGGVAIYESDTAVTRSGPHELMKATDSDLMKIDRKMLVTEHCGDICAVETTVNGQKLLVVSVYISPGTTMKEIKAFFFTNLLMYTPKMLEMYKELEDDLGDMTHYAKMPIILSGDLNVDVSKPENKHFVDFMKRAFALNLKTDISLPTTRNHTCIDTVFTRNLEKLACLNYVSYFSHHRPVLSLCGVD